MSHCCFCLFVACACCCSFEDDEAPRFFKDVSDWLTARSPAVQPASPRVHAQALPPTSSAVQDAVADYAASPKAGHAAAAAAIQLQALEMV